MDQGTLAHRYRDSLSIIPISGTPSTSAPASRSIRSSHLQVSCWHRERELHRLVFEQEVCLSSPVRPPRTHHAGQPPAPSLPRRRLKARAGERVRCCRGALRPDDHDDGMDIDLCLGSRRRRFCAKSDSCSVPHLLILRRQHTDSSKVCCWYSVKRIHNRMLCSPHEKQHHSEQRNRANCSCRV